MFRSWLLSSRFWYCFTWNKWWFLVVPPSFIDKINCNICDQILEGLELIDDECDVFGIHMVKIQDPQLAKRYSIKTFPALVYFRNGNPLLFEGDMQNEQSVLEWLIDDGQCCGVCHEVLTYQEALIYIISLYCLLFIDSDNRELADEIEEVNERMLERLLDESSLLVVFFCGLIWKKKTAIFYFLFLEFQLQLNIMSVL